MSARRGSGAGASVGDLAAARSGPAAALRKVLRADEEMIKMAGAGIVGARVAVFWHDDENYYKGKLVQFDGYHKRHKIVYDDGEEEWVSLTREAFRWLTPRARSAGCTPELRHLMQQLGAEDCGAGGLAGMSTRRQAVGGTAGGAPGGEAAAAGAAPRGEACVGWQVSVLFDGDGQRYRGEVVAWDPRRGQALILFDDGEDEWVDLGREELTWHCQLAGHSGVYPGLPRGQVPSGAAAVGWRIGVFWPADQAFYSGEIVGYDAVHSKHDVAYDDGEEGPVGLTVDKVKWILPPGAAVDREKLEAADARARRRGGDESDPDYEVLEYRPRAPARRSMQLSPAPLLGGGGGLHAWDAAAGAEAALAESAGAAGYPNRFVTLPHVRAHGPSGGGGGEQAPQHLGRPVVVRQLTRAVGLASLNGGGSDATVSLPQPITVRIYMSSAVNSTGSAASADTALVTGDAAAVAAAAAAAAAAGVAAGCGGGDTPARAAAAAAAAPRLHGRARLQARQRALEQMSRRVAKAQQTIVKGVPTPLPSGKAAAAEAARQARSAAGGAGVTSPTAAQRHQQLMLGSSHASGLHRLARGSAVNYSPFHHKRPHPADSEGSSSSGTSEEEDEEEEEEEGDMGADSAEPRRGGLDPSDPAFALPLSPRCIPKGGKIKPGGEQEPGSGELGMEAEGSMSLSDAMIAPMISLGQQSPAVLSPFKMALACPPALGGGMDGSPAGMMLATLGSGMGVGASSTLPGLAGIPHSASMDMMLPLPVGLARADSMANLMAGAGLGGIGGLCGGVGGLTDSRNTSAMLGGGHSGILGLGSTLGHGELDDTGTGGAAGRDLLGGLAGAHGVGTVLDALQPDARD